MNLCYKTKNKRKILNVKQGSFLMQMCRWTVWKSAGSYFYSVFTALLYQHLKWSTPNSFLIHMLSTWKGKAAGEKEGWREKTNK